MKADRRPETPDTEETPVYEKPPRLGECVLQALGEPQGLHAVQVRRLWEDHYRVNVFVQRNDAAVVISDSFFVVTDSQGNILTSVPSLTRHY